MSSFENAPAGMPCWVDLAAPAIDSACAFYGSVLGWTWTDPESGADGYRMGQVDGRIAAGIGPLQGDQQRASWTLYLASDDAVKTAATISDCGGNVLLPPVDVGSRGRMLIARDPSGGAFGVWEARDQVGAELVNEPGGLVWEDLRSSDPETAWTFYADVFGYQVNPLPMAGPDYVTFHLPGREAPLGGMGGMMGSPEGTPSHWLVYFCVSEADAAVNAAVAGGGTVVDPASDSPFGRMATLADPAGAVFVVMQLPEETP